MKQTKPRNLIRLFLTGFCMGAADIVPGVSGGTIAFIFGIYEELIYSIKLLSSKVLRHFLKGEFKQGFDLIPFTFLVPLATGIFTALLGLASLISYLLEHQPAYLWSFFFGLVLASVVVVSKRVTNWSPQNLIIMIVFSIFAYVLVGSVPVETPNNLPAMFLAGAIAICAMILPGISGSFLLVIMGKYEQVLGAVLDKDILTIGVFGLGAIVGLGIFSRLLSWLFAHHHNLVVSALIGFMIGSLRKVWPWKEVISWRVDRHGVQVPLKEMNILPQTFDDTVFFALVLMFMGMLLILFLEQFQATKEHTHDVNHGFDKQHKKALKKNT